MNYNILRNFCVETIHKPYFCPAYLCRPSSQPSYSIVLVDVIENCQELERDLPCFGLRPEQDMEFKSRQV